MKKTSNISLEIKYNKKIISGNIINIFFLVNKNNNDPTTKLAITKNGDAKNRRIGT